MLFSAEGGKKPHKYVSEKEQSRIDQSFSNKPKYWGSPEELSIIRMPLPDLTIK